MFEEMSCSHRVKTETVHTGSYTFRWDNIYSRAYKIGDEVVSPSFDLCGSKWHLSVFPYGDKSKDDEGHLGLYLMCESGSSRFAAFKFYIVNQYSNKEILTTSAGRFFSASGTLADLMQYYFKITLFGVGHQGYGSNQCLTHEKLFSAENGYYVNDAVLLRVEISVKGCSFTESGGKNSLFTQIPRYESLAAWTKELMGVNLAGQSMRFKFPACHEELSVHKMILAANSPVFRLMLNAGTPETLISEVLIDDIDLSAMKRLVRFMYTKSFGHDGYLANTELAKALFVAARKYAVDDAAVICEQALSKNVTGANLASLLSFAETMNATELKKRCVNYGLNSNTNMFYEAQYGHILGMEESDSMSLLLQPEGGHFKRRRIV
jgi:hypothetical protein